jgi:hypothetical protein
MVAQFIRIYDNGFHYGTRHGKELKKQEIITALGLK